MGQFLPWPPETCFATDEMVVRAASTLAGGNQYLVSCERTRSGAVVDARDASSMRWSVLASRARVRVGLVVQTDVGKGQEEAIAATKRSFGNVPVFAHEAAFSGADRFVKDGDVVEVGELRLHVIETPGPGTNGHVALYEPSQGVAFVGNLLTRGGFSPPLVLSAEQHEERRKSLRRLVEVLPESCILMPGHFGVTTIAAERRNNPDLLGIEGPPLTPLAKPRPRTMSRAWSTTAVIRPSPNIIPSSASSASASASGTAAAAAAASSGAAAATTAPSRTRSSWYTS